MKTGSSFQHRSSHAGFRRRSLTQGFTYLELLVAGAVAAVLLILILTMVFQSQQSFALMSSYTELDASSHRALDYLSKEIHGATQVIGSKTNLPEKTLTFTNAVEGGILQLIWDSDLRTLSINETGRTNWTLLRDCDSWNYSLYDGAPVISNNAVMPHPAATLADCKLVQLSWTCSRTIVGKVKTTGAESALIGLRNRAR